MVTDAADAHKGVPLFAGLGNKELDRLARSLKERVFREGASVTREGETGAGFFVIAEGTATVSVDGEVKATLGPGDYFGEVALIDEGVRSASIVAATDLRLLRPLPLGVQAVRRGASAGRLGAPPDACEAPARPARLTPPRSRDTNRPSASPSSTRSVRARPGVPLSEKTAVAPAA